MKKCPFCKEDIQDEAVKCKHCGEWLAPQDTIDKQDNLSDVKIVTKVAEKTESLPKEEKPRLFQQNFKLGKILSGVQLLLIILFITYYIIRFMRILSPSETENAIIHFGYYYIASTVVSLFILGVGLAILNMLNQYLLNFELYNNVRENLKYVGIGFVLLFALSLSEDLFFFITRTFLPVTVTVLLYTILFVAFLILYALSGWRLARFDGDYVGGLSMLGYTMCLSILLPVLFFAIPILTYSIFAKAEDYAEHYGFVED